MADQSAHHEKDQTLKDEKTSDVKSTRWKYSKKPYLTNAITKGMITSGEQHLLYDAVLRLGKGDSVNLGVGSGASTYALACGLKENNVSGIIYAIDIFTSARENFRVPKLTLNFGPEMMQYVEFCSGTTERFGEILKDKVFNFVFIDAAHDYNSCKLDFNLYSPLIRVGGELAFHDCHILDVDRVIREINTDLWEFKEQIFTTKLFKKVG